MSRLKKLWIILILMEAVCSVSFYAAETDKSSDTKATWILAAIPFEFENVDLTAEFSKAIAEDIPSLILEQVSSQAIRVPSAREILNRNRDELRTERLALFLELSKAEKTRDSIVLQNVTEKKMKKLLEAQEAVISELHKKISENLQKNDRSGKNATDDILKEESFFDAPKGPRDFFASGQEPISIYNDDPSKLFTLPKDVSSTDYSGYAFENAVNSAKIKGLISGSIRAYGGYAAVTAELHLYPGGTLSATVTEVGLLSSPLQLARNLARSLMPQIANNPPVVLQIAVEPPEAFQKVVVGLDGIIFPSVPNSLVTDRGMHELSFEAEGFRNAYVSYSFSEKNSYKIDVSMIPENPKTVSIRLVNPVPGIFSSDAVNSFSLSPEDPETQISVDGRPVIGHFTSEHDISSFFYISEAMLAKNDSFEIDALDYDVGENIEKRRRKMYTAYSALIMSLPFSFYNYGTFVNKLNGNASGIVDADEVERWRNRALVCVGISTSLGVVFAYQLVRYLFSTNAVLPQTVDASEKK